MFKQFLVRQVQLLLLKVDLAVMLMNRYSVFPEAPGTSPSDGLVSYQAHSFGVVLRLCRATGGEFYCPSRLS